MAKNNTIKKAPQTVEQVINQAIQQSKKNQQDNIIQDVVDNLLYSDSFRKLIKAQVVATLGGK